jgi:hypothetical protein
MMKIIVMVLLLLTACNPTNPPLPTLVPAASFPTAMSTEIIASETPYQTIEELAQGVMGSALEGLTVETYTEYKGQVYPNGRIGYDVDITMTSPEKRTREEMLKLAYTLTREFYYNFADTNPMFIALHLRASEVDLGFSDCVFGLGIGYITNLTYLPRELPSDLESWFNSLVVSNYYGDLPGETEALLAYGNDPASSPNCNITELKDAPVYTSNSASSSEPQFTISDTQFSDMVERVFDEWDRIIDEDGQLTNQYITDFNYYLEAEFCGGDFDCELDALDNVFEVKESYLDAMFGLQQDLIAANQQLWDIHRSDVSPEMEPVLIEVRNAGNSFETYFTYTLMANVEESGSTAQERLLDQALDALDEAVDHYELAWNIYIGEADATDIQRVLNQPESLEFIGSGNRIREFSLSVASGIQVNGTHHGDSNFIGEIYDSSGELEDIVLNCIGWCTDGSITQLDSGTYYLEVTADGDWEVIIEILK